MRPGKRTIVGTEEGKEVLPGTVVGVRVDMNERTLAFRVNGGDHGLNNDWLPAKGAVLPAAVRRVT